MCTNYDDDDWNYLLNVDVITRCITIRLRMCEVRKINWSSCRVKWTCRIWNCIYIYMH